MHVQPSSRARCLIFGWTLHLLPYFVCVISDGSGEAAQMRRFASAFTGRLCDKYQNLMSWLELFRDISHYQQSFFDLGSMALFNLYEPQNDKTNKMNCAPSEDSDQPGHPPSLIRVFTVRMKKAWVFSYPLNAQQRLTRLG